MRVRKLWCLVFIYVFLLFDISGGYAFSVIDTSGNEEILAGPPKRVISLVPEITDIIVKLQATKSLVGVTYHSYNVPPNIKRVGGFLSPCVDEILKLAPELVFVSSVHSELKKVLHDKGIKVLQFDARSINDIIKNIMVIGKIFNKKTEAENIIEAIRRDMDFVNRKLQQMGPIRRKRVLRIMGRNTVMTPGDDSFQNDYIRAAGGIPPRWGKKGQALRITLRQWKDFNPEVIYYCGGDSKVVEFIKESEGWKDVVAVRQGRIYNFPCSLTCRASVNAGYFVKWLFSKIYEDEMLSSKNLLFREGIFSRRRIELSLSYVEQAEIVYSKLKDYTAKALLVKFKRPMKIVSTLEGQREGIVEVGNHYLPPTLWGWAHRAGLKGSREYIYKVLGLNQADSSLLFTGADMDNLAIVKETFRDITVYALVTAGVRTNALRTSVDEGRFYEPGTINIILMTNMKLTPRAMTRAIITATEAKTSALQDLDVRSSQTPLISQATGTGTDNVLVVQGEGVKIDNSGGHTRMGELIGRAVYKAVLQAIERQNGIYMKRDVFQRLQERGINLYDVVSNAEIPDSINKKMILAKLERLLLEPEYAGFMLAALRLSDSCKKEKPIIRSFKKWASLITKEIKGNRVKSTNYILNPQWPEVLRIAFDALIGGIIDTE